MARTEEQNQECPLCLEPLEIDDLNFFPCTCGYQICRFCWHRIRTDENGLCPACRKQYPEDPADFKPVSVEEVQRIKNEKRQKDLQKRQKVSDKRKSLSQVRVVQNNLVFVVGLPPRLADADTLKKHEYFGKYGKLHKIVVNNCTSYAGSQGPSASAYVTYEKAEDALHALKAVNNIQVDGRSLKASLGTTKYCSHFLRNQQCPKPDCMYLHEFGAVAGSFTKEEMQQGKHQEYERKLIEQILDVSVSNRKNTVSSSSSDGEETWPLPSENQNISANSKAQENQTKQLTLDHNSVMNSLCDENITEQRKQGKSSTFSQSCELTEKLSVDTTKRNSLLSLNALQCKLENMCVSNSSSSGSRESLYSANSDGQISTKNVNSCESTSKSDSDYETDKTDREVQHELFNTERSRDASCSESPEFFSSNSSLSTPDSTMSDGPMPFSPSSSPVVTSHMQMFSKTNCSQTSEPRPYLMKNVGMPPGFGYHIPEASCSPNNPLPVTESSSVSLNSHTGLGWEALGFPVGCRTQNRCWPDSTQDDDLGFDPFDESNKGLADLLQQEANEKANSTTNVRSSGIAPRAIDDSVFDSSFIRSSQHQSKMPPPGFSANVTSDYTAVRSPFINGLMPDSTLPDLSRHLQRIPQSVPSDAYQEYVPKPNVMNNFNSHSSSPGALNSKLNRLYTKELQEGFKALLPNINIKFGSVAPLSARLPPGLTPNQKINSQREDYSWLSDPAIVSSANITNGTTWTNYSPQWLNSQLLAEENARKYNGFINSCYRNFSPRAQPSPAHHTPPPGFNLSLNSLRPLHTLPENSKTNDSQWYFGRM